MKNILFAGALAMAGTLFGTHLLIRFLVHKGYGQFIRDDGPTSHHTKRGTPTMGGLVIIVASVLGYFLAHLITMTRVSASALLIIYLFVALGFVGFLDDWTKISRQRSLGLNGRAKLILQGLIGASFAYLSLTQFKDFRGNHPASTFVSALRDIDWLKLPLLLAIIWIMILIAAASNAVNLTDGLDGLATGAATMVFVAYALLNMWQRNQWCGSAPTAGPLCYEVRNPQDLAVVSMALAGACFGFLWWNAKPAKIFMGDTGSLAIGGAVAGLAIFSRTQLLLVIIGGLFVLITMSVILQVGVFKLTKGKRLFRMAPLQHHFELVGWSEETIVIRFWIICGLSVAAGLGIFYGEWVAQQ
ncbi:MAG TPA: phospho-N-acetylmuramoyl-pentapeptide-transferase [Propionibacteriaceae bacterium]|nr:phospho-N-acetylmuramoyl-pentapeptide-transferase [Propionibacteriaceae bacterium]